MAGPDLLLYAAKLESILDLAWLKPPGLNKPPAASPTIESWRINQNRAIWFIKSSRNEVEPTLSDIDSENKMALVWNLDSELLLNMWHHIICLWIFPWYLLGKTCNFDKTLNFYLNEFHLFGNDQSVVSHLFIVIVFKTWKYRRVNLCRFKCASQRMSLSFINVKRTSPLITSKSYKFWIIYL